MIDTNVLFRCLRVIVSLGSLIEANSLCSGSRNVPFTAIREVEVKAGIAKYSIGAPSSSVGTSTESRSGNVLISIKSG